MEAVAHSPAFAKKVGVPKSVGEDFSQADKGRKFGKGGDMAESKKMVGKEVAFMKKKGAPAAMIKHEKSEMMGMKKGGKVRRMAGGGMGDPFERDTDYDKEKAQGAATLKRLKGLFGNREEKEPALIDRSRDIDRTTKSNEGAVYTPRPPLGITKPNNQSPRTSSGASAEEDAVERSDAAMLAASMDKTAKGPQFISSIAKDEGEYSGDGLSPVRRTELRPPRNKPVMFSKTRETTSVTPAKNKVPVNKIPAAIDSAKLLKDAEEEALRKKPTAMTEQMRKVPTIRELYKGQKSMGEEVDDVLKNFRESIRGGLQKGKERQESKGSTMYAKGGNVKKMAEGGFAREADGVAKKGKTQGKVVKMASGGFVKTADGCAQRGKTKAFQVKMNRGGMC